MFCAYTYVLMLAVTFIQDKRGTRTILRHFRGNADKARGNPLG
jgi:hypothetical protein